MNIVDVIIILIIIGCVFFGYKRGFTKELVNFLGFFIVIILAFLLKNPLASLMYEHLPFFNFDGIFKGITSLNILLYEVLAFFIVVSILLIVLKLLKFITSTFEKLLSFTVILGIPSKLLGALVGFIEGIAWSFIICYIVSLPLFNIKEVNNSKFRNDILNKTPILTIFTNDVIGVIDEFTKIKDDYQNNKEMSSDEFNLKTLDLMLKYKITTVESVDKLREKGKIKIPKINDVLNKYREEE